MTAVRGEDEGGDMKKVKGYRQQCDNGLRDDGGEGWVEVGIRGGLGHL